MDVRKVILAVVAVKLKRVLELDPPGEYRWRLRSAIRLLQKEILMPLPGEHPSAEYGLTEREIAMRKPNWEVGVENWRELGEAIATFNIAIGNFHFVGTAAMTVEDRVVKLEITLLHEMGECSGFSDGPKCGTPVCERCKGVPF